MKEGHAWAIKWLTLCLIRRDLKIRRSIFRRIREKPIKLSYIRRRLSLCAGDGCRNIKIEGMPEYRFARVSLNFRTNDRGNLAKATVRLSRAANELLTQIAGVHELLVRSRSKKCPF